MPKRPKIGDIALTIGVSQLHCVQNKQRLVQQDLIIMGKGKGGNKGGNPPAQDVNIITVIIYVKS